MFSQAKIRLTVRYSLLFFAALWVFSLGIFGWMSRSLGQGYISQVREERNRIGSIDFNDTHTQIVTTAGSVALNRLLRELITVNAVFMVLVPQLAWYLANQSFVPVEDAHRKQKQFVSDASHELRTPLSVIKGEMEIALKNDRPSAYYRRVILRSIEEINRLSELVENLLFFARQHQSNDGLTQTVDLTDCISNSLMKLSTKAKAKELRLNFVPDNEISLIKGNNSLIEQLMYNLIHNAIRYTPKLGQITVTLKNYKRKIVISVKDTGIGISKNDLPNIFDRFYRVNQARVRTRGYGLGLAIVKNIVEYHHGEIAVHSKIGTGSTFIVTLPR